MKNETNTQHTPGPWKIKTAGTFDNAGIIGQVRLPSEKGKYWITIAECDYDAYIKGISAHQTDHHKRSNDVAFLRSLQKANAQLIARAPELLKENQELKESLNEKVKSGVEAIWERDFYKNQSIELLSALKDCEQVLWAYKDMIFRECAHNVNDQYNKAKAAISKAEGKTLVGS